MALYLTIIIVANIIIAGANILFGTATFGYSPLFVILATIGTTVFQFAIDGLFAIIINKLPNKWFAVDKKCFQVSKKTQRFYEKLKIKKWKDKVWELGGLGGFRKNKLSDPDNPEYLERFIIESNKGIVTHRIGYFVGFLGIFLIPLKYALVIGIPVALVNLFLNILSTMILKYNLPKLHTVYKWKLRQNIANKEETQKDNV